MHDSCHTLQQPQSWIIGAQSRHLPLPPMHLRFAVSGEFQFSDKRIWHYAPRCTQRIMPGQQYQFVQELWHLNESCLLKTEMRREPTSCAVLFFERNVPCCLRKLNLLNKENHFSFRGVHKDMRLISDCDWVSWQFSFLNAMCPVAWENWICLRKKKIFLFVAYRKTRDWSVIASVYHGWSE